MAITKLIKGVLKGKKKKEGVVGEKLNPSAKSQQIQNEIDFEKFDKAVKKDIKKGMERQELQSFTKNYVNKVVKPALKNKTPLKKLSDKELDKIFESEAKKSIRQGKVDYLKKRGITPKDSNLEKLYESEVKKSIRKTKEDYVSKRLPGPKKMKRGGMVKSSVRKPVKRRSSGVALRGYGKEIK